jgi:hypothetical protein
MTPGWKIVTVLPNPGGGSPLQEWCLVAIAYKGSAVRAVKARHPHAAIRVDSEADAELLAKYDVKDGKIFVLVEGS